VQYGYRLLHPTECELRVILDHFCSFILAWVICYALNYRNSYLACVPRKFLNQFTNI
jgi:hypothetical protein